MFGDADVFGRSSDEFDSGVVAGDVYMTGGTGGETAGQNGDVDGFPLKPNKLFMQEAIGTEYGEGFEKTNVLWLCLFNYEEKAKRENPIRMSAKTVLELEAGIGRFTGELAQKAGEVIALDFIESAIKKKRKVVNEFNASSKWRKRGISCVPAVYGVSLRLTPGRVSVLSDGSIVVEVPGIEIGQGLWTKVKQMAAFSLGLIQCSTTSDELLEKICVIQADTLSLVQGSVTGGSTSSEASSEAVRICCDGLVERLLPVKTALEEKT
ncbi:unnamed protein product [Eruca vesicaria subsp. sativa]|uniref:Aldehyde oxidase/xanthine dehydrogenase second molybdopterin binding domain-containing protein n=1 Tax=Eruca vesicaria subsp. sativa TaxID=29727 RepID=A0ABC8LKI3_ERUVS|nr:unnamed protein product [Eruca vesicaria subsp. sativa]